MIPPDPKPPVSPPAPPGTGGDSSNPGKSDPPPNVGETALKLQSFSFPVVSLNAQGKEISRVQKENKYFVEDLGRGIGLDMVAIPGGSFLMGSPEGEGDVAYEEPQHRVMVSPFYMGKFPVTQGEWSAVAAMPKVQRALNPDPARFKGAMRPVENVSRDDAVEFCQRLSRHTKREYRLPSEAEWEYACRSGTTTPFHFGPAISPDFVNCRPNVGMALLTLFSGETTNVGSYKVANTFGLYDMHGNVWEWCLDHWHDSYEGAPTDGSAWLSSDESKSRLRRGGSWNDLPWSCRSASRFRYARDDRGSFIGFRLVCASSWAL